MYKYTSIFHVFCAAELLLIRSYSVWKKKLGLEYTQFISQHCKEYQNMELDGRMLVNINWYQIVYDKSFIAFKIKV